MKFLLVDDNDISLEIQKLMLESCGLDVVTAENGRDAVKLAEQEDFFMIFMDIHMPELNGFETSELIRKSNSKVPIIALSADEIAEDDPNFIAAGMNGALLKPLQMEKLKQLLNDYLNVSFVAGNASDENAEVFNYDGLLAVMKDEKAIIHLIERFLSVHTDDCTLLRKYVENGDFLRAREIMHNVRGISGNLFCRQLYKISCELNVQLRSERAESLDRFSEIWETTIKELSDRLDILTSAPTESGAVGDWKTVSENFFALCMDFDVAAVDIFVENSSVFKSKLDPDQFKKLETAVFNYDFIWITDNMEVLNV